VTEIRWDRWKSLQLKLTRGASFEDLFESKHIKSRGHPSRPNQQMAFYEYQGYVWVIPFVEQGNVKFLKTLYRSRKFTKLYRKGLL
jgi:hypothetical protein